MQMSIRVPDNLPAQRIHQRIRELEESLQEEAKFINELSKKTQPNSLTTDLWDNPDLDCPTTELTNYIQQSSFKKLDRLKKRDCVIGDPEDLVHIEWYRENINSFGLIF